MHAPPKPGQVSDKHNETTGLGWNGLILTLCWQGETIIVPGTVNLPWSGFSPICS